MHDRHSLSESGAATAAARRSGPVLPRRMMSVLVALWFVGFVTYLQHTHRAAAGSRTTARRRSRLPVHNWQPDRRYQLVLH